MSESSANAASPTPSERTVASDCVSVPRTGQGPVREAGGTAHRAEYGWVEQLIKTEGPGILRMLWRLLGREQDVLDAYQDCFCKLTSLQDHRDLVNVRAYAYRTATNIAIELIRLRTRQAVHREAVATRQAGTEAERDAGKENEIEVGQLRDAIGGLPKHLRNVLVLRDLTRMSYKEVGKTLGIEPATARVYRRHAIVKLTELLGEGDAE